MNSDQAAGVPAGVIDTSSMPGHVSTTPPGKAQMVDLIESKLRMHRDTLHRLQACLDQQMALDIRKRDGSTLRFLYSQISMYQLVVEELDDLLAHSASA
jgi:hypothetical protein